MVEPHAGTIRAQYVSTQPRVDMVIKFVIPVTVELNISDFTIMQQNAWVNGADVEKTDLFESFDPAEAFEEYGAYQQRILAVEPEQ